MVVMLNPLGNRVLQFPRIVVMFEFDDVLQGPVIALDLALRLRVVGSAAGVSHLPLVQIVPEFARDVGGAVVAQ